jgi:hypothetical protein
MYLCPVVHGLMSSRAFLVFLCLFFCYVVPVFVSSCSCPCVLLFLSLRPILRVCVCPIEPVFVSCCACICVSSCSCPCVFLYLSLRPMVRVCVSSCACLLCPAVPVFVCPLVPALVSSCAPVLASYGAYLCVILCLSLSPVVPVFMCPLFPAIVFSIAYPCALRCQFVYPPMPVFVLWRLSLSLLCFARSSISACRGSCQRAEKDEHSLFLPPQKWQV